MKILRPSEIPAEVQRQALFIGESSMQPLIDKGMSKDFWSCLRRWAPGTRAKFHTHTSDQLIIVTEGKGMMVTEKEVVTVTPGEIVFIPAEEKHWHGATKETSVAYIQIQAGQSQTTQFEG
jgi:mannose-6-phosphate isomerase-like protein (cupin superfamily)